MAKRKTNIILRLFSNTVFLLNIAAVVWLVLCYYASTTHPASIKFIALFSLTTSFAIATNIFFIVFWLCSVRKLRLILSLGALLVFHEMIPAAFGYHFFSKNDWTTSSSRFKLMSWNTHGMGIYIPEKEQQLASGIVKLIEKESPDILCLPEFSVNAAPQKNKHLRQIINQNNYQEYRINTNHILNKKRVIGTAILSKHPIEAYKVYDLSPEIYLIECDVKVHKMYPVRIFILHLHSFGLTDQDKHYIEKLKKNSEDIKKSKSFIGRFNAAYIARADEASQVAEVVSQSKYPTVVCGDFNDLPNSFTYTKIKGSLTDAFVKKGTGFGRTYNQIIPTLRIDHIFYSGDFLNLKAFKTIQTPLSDHNPVIANFEIITMPKP